ncbi:MAG: glycosyl hydrolase family 18 protein [Byssovorax sp.]
MVKRYLGWLTTGVMLLGGAGSACTLASKGVAEPAGKGGGASSADAGSTGDTGSSGGGTTAAATSGAGGGTTAGGGCTGGGAPVSTTRVVAYLPNYSGSFGGWAKKIDFKKMTHLNLAFATATGSNDWDLGADDQDVKALVDAAHAAGTKVLASLGGGGGDQTVIARYKDAGNIDELVDKLDTFVTAHNLDGADIDIEDPNNLGDHYSTFVSKTVARLRPEGKLVTAAVAQYLQDSMSDDTLHSFDFVNVMVYTNYDDSVSALDYYSQNKGVPKDKLTLGAGFFGQDSNYNEYAYKDILAADGNAWSYDQTTVNGTKINYTGMASMKKIAEYSRGFGGIMFWELSQDVTDEHSLYKVIQGAL